MVKLQGGFAANTEQQADSGYEGNHSKLMRDNGNGTLTAVEPLKRLMTAGAAYIAAYIALDLISYVKPYGTFGVTPWNPQIGLTLALAYFGGIVAAPFFLIAQLITNYLLRGGPMGFGLELATSVVSGGAFFIAGTALRQKGLIDPRLQSVRDVLNLLMAIMAAAAAAAFLFTIIIALGGELGRGDFGHVAWRLLIGDVIGCLTITPLILIFASLRPWPTPRLDAAFQIATLIGALIVVFGYQEATAFQLFYLLFLPLLWIALSYGTAGAAIAILIIQIGLLIGAEFRFGTDPGLTVLQVLMFAVALTGLLVGAIFIERENAATRIRDQQSALDRAMRTRAAGEVAAGITHEINQPLTALRTYATVARSALQNNNMELALDSLAKVNAQSDRVANVLKSIRDLLHQGTIDIAPVNIDDLLRDFAELMASDLASRGITLRITVPAGFPLVRIDGVQITQALHNLVNNAADAMAGIGQHGAIGIVVSWVASKTRPEFAISVTDEGPGFPPGVNTERPVPFVTTKSEGTGIGLSIARTVAEAHGGRLTIASAATGACVRIILPFKEAGHEETHFGS
ncbi:MAG: ATP-binding protein [Hyphomicrobiaceae bacterium]